MTFKYIGLVDLFERPLFVPKKSRMKLLEMWKDMKIKHSYLRIYGLPAPGDLGIE